MYKLILGIILLVISTLTFGQNFSLQELININNKNWDDFDTHATKKGYSYFKTEDDWFGESKYYALGQRNQKAQYFISKTIVKSDSTKLVSFQTVKSKDYLASKKQLKKMGFNYVDTRTNENGTISINYIKGNLSVNLASFQGKNSNDELITGYEISVTEKKE